jgi:hypothetical protein
LSGIHAEGPGEPLVGERVLSYNCALEDPGGELPVWWRRASAGRSSGRAPTRTATSLCRCRTSSSRRTTATATTCTPRCRCTTTRSGSSSGWRARGRAVQVRRVDDAGPTTATRRCRRRTRTCRTRRSTTRTGRTRASPRRGATMIFGQGHEVDFGYDGEVVYHELGHGMVSLLTPDGLGGRKERPDGLLADAGGLNEAVSDYFSVMLANDPELGDYVARFWPGYGASIRSAENKNVCPDDIGRPGAQRRRAVDGGDVGDAQAGRRGEARPAGHRDADAAAGRRGPRGRAGRSTTWRRRGSRRGRGASRTCSSWCGRSTSAGCTTAGA